MKVMATKVKNQSTDRQKIEIKKIERKLPRSYFHRAPEWSFNKASELCGAEAAAIAFSPGKKAYAFGYPSVDNVIDSSYLGGNTNEGRLVNTSTTHHQVVQESRKQYTEALAKEEEKKPVEVMEEGRKVGFGSDKPFWWDLISIEEMELEELEQYVASMEELKKNVGIRVEELEKASNSPSRFLALDSGLYATDQFGC